MNGTLQSIANRRALALLPINTRAPGDRPINVKPTSEVAVENLDFFQRKSYPGWTGSAPDYLIAAIIPSILR